MKRIAYIIIVALISSVGIFAAGAQPIPQKKLTQQDAADDKAISVVTIKHTAKQSWLESLREVIFGTRTTKQWKSSDIQRSEKFTQSSNVSTSKLSTSRQAYTPSPTSYALPQIGHNTLPSYHSSSYAGARSVSANSSNPYSAAANKGLHVQSDATEKSFGGIGSSNQIAENGGRNFRSTSSTAHSGSSYSCMISPVGASVPKAYSKNEVNGQTDDNSPRKVNENPGIPYPDPIGDVPWLLMLIALGAYAIARRTIRKTNS